MTSNYVVRILVAVCACYTLVASPGAGGALYKQRCAKCHDVPRHHVPARASIANRSPEDLIAALTTGSMKVEAGGLAPDEVRAITFFLTGKAPAAIQPPRPDGKLCTGSSEPIDPHGPQWNGWGNGIENARFQENPGLKA